MVALGLAGWLWRQGRRAAERHTSEITASRAELDRLTRVQDAAPFGLARLVGDGLEVSKSLSRLLGAAGDELRSLDALAPYFEADDLTRLIAAVGAWRGGAAAPREQLTSADGERTIEVTGFQAGEDEGDLALAFHDLGNLVRRRRALEDEARTVAVEATRLAQILDSLPLPVWERDQDMRIAWCNAAYAHTVAREIADVIADGDLEIEPAIMAGHGRALATAARRQGSRQRETRHIVVDGQRRALSVSEIPLGDEARGVGYAEDVTDREEIEAEFKRYVDANTDVMNNLNAAIAVFESDRRLAFFNNAFARLWRLDENWLATHPTHSELIDAIRDNRLLPEEADYLAYKNSLMSLYTNLLETQEEYTFLPDGRTLRSLISPHPLGGLLMVYEDVTDRLMLERSYNTLIAVQRETLANLHEALAVFGSDGRLKLFNPGYAELWRLDEQLLRGEPHVSEVIDLAIAQADENASWAQQRDAIVAGTTERRAGSGRMELFGGTIVDYSAVPLPDGNMLYTYLDVTDSVGVERALRERAEALETADRLKTEFIANMSYELRSPLNVIIGFTEILGNEYFGELNEGQREYCRGILDSSHQLLALINDILDLASIEAGRLELETKELDVKLMLDGLLGLAREGAREQDITLELDCAADLGEIRADERRLKQVVFNLLSNAIKYSGEHTTVTIGARREAKDIVLWVQDQGVGIEEEDQDLVFDRFQRGPGSNFGRGAGLGLAIVKSYVELHGGNVDLKSEPDIGTRVTVRLPAAIRS